MSKKSTSLKTNTSSKYRGVYLRKDSGRFRAELRHNKKKYSLGTYDSEVEAARAYNKKAKQMLGDSAILNKV